MKLNINRNYCLFAILIIVLLFCCLGNNILEGMNNSSDPAIRVEKAGIKEANIVHADYQNLLNREGITDKHGCRPSYGEFWCDSTQTCIAKPNLCPKPKNYPKHPSDPDHPGHPGHPDHPKQHKHPKHPDHPKHHHHHHSNKKN